METLLFLFKYLLASTLLMLFYWGVMRRRASYRLRRNYLMLIPLLGLMGFMHFSVTVTSTDDDIDQRQTPVAPTVVHYVPASGALTEVTEPIDVVEVDDPSSRPMEPMAYLVEPEADRADLHLESLLDNVLPLVSVLLLLFGLCQVVKMLMLKAKLPCTRTAEGYGLIRSAEVVTPFSFGRTIFLPTDMDRDCEEMVLMHEKAHIAHGHYREVWGIDLLICFLWFNPIVWLCRNELLKVHEFEADHDVLGQGIDKYDYQMSLLQMSMNVSCPVVSGFSQPLIYQRFVEMKASVAGTLSSVGKVGLLAWVAGLFGIFSFYACQVTTVQSEGNPTPSSELFATLDSLPRLEKPETFTFEYICDSLCRDTVLYVFLSDDFFHFSNPVPAETLHVKDGKMTFQMELDHVIGMKWHLLPDNRLGFEHFCSPGDTLRYIAKSDENGKGRSWSPEESRTLRDNVDKYIHEFRDFTQYQSPHMPKYDCTKWTDPVEEQSLYWSNISRQKEKLYAVKNVYFTDTATIVQVLPRFDFVVFGFRFLEDTCTCLIDDQGNKYKYIKTIYPSYHLDATVFGTYGVFEPINPNNIKSFSLMGPEPTVYTTIKNIRPRKQQTVSDVVKPLPEQSFISAKSPSFEAAFEAPKERLDDTIPGSSYTLGVNDELKKKKQMDYDQWNTLCETYRNEPDVEYQNMKDTARYVSQLEHVLGAHTDVGVKMDEEILRAERLVVRNPKVAKRLYEDVYAIDAKRYIGQRHLSSKTTSNKIAKFRVAFDEMNGDGILIFTYVESKEVPLPPEKQDSCLVIINGVERPEFATKQQAVAYIESLKLGKWSSTYNTIPTFISNKEGLKHVFEIFYD